MHGTLDVRLCMFAFPMKDIDRETDSLVQVITNGHQMSIEPTVVIIEDDVGHRVFNAKDLMDHILKEDIITRCVDRGNGGTYNGLRCCFRSKKSLSSNDDTTDRSGAHV